MDQNTLHIKLNILYIKHCMSHMNLHITLMELSMIYLIAHIVDGFGLCANIVGCKMNEYRHMTYNIHFCSWNNFTDGTPYNRVNCWLITLHQNHIASQISKVICINRSDQHAMMCLFHCCVYVFRTSRMLQ